MLALQRVKIIYKFSINLMSLTFKSHWSSSHCGSQSLWWLSSLQTCILLLTSIFVIWQVSQSPELIDMTGKNFTEVTFFILSGFANHPELQVSFFLMFLFIYLFTVLGNLGLIMLIRIDSQLHTPMYFFLSNVAFIDIRYSSTLTPKALVNF